MRIQVVGVLNFHMRELGDGMAYLGYFFKPNDHQRDDWIWLLKKVDLRIDNWCYMWLYLGGKLSLVKSILERSPTY